MYGSAQLKGGNYHFISKCCEIPKGIQNKAEELAAKVLVVAKKVVTAMTEVLGCDGYNVLQNNGEVAGQTVFHFHMHLVPRYENDNVNIKWKPGTLKEEWKEEILAKMNKK